MRSKEKGSAGTTVTLAIACVAIVVGAISMNRLRDSTPAAPQFQTAPAQRGRFVRTIPAIGDVKSYRPTTVYSSVRRREEREIISLVPQGTFVEEGELVCVLDASDLQEEYSTPALAVIADDARLARAENDELKQGALNQRRLATTERVATGAQLSLEAYEKAEYSNLADRLSGQIDMKEEDLGQAAGDFEHAQDLVREGVITSTNFNRQETRLQRSQRELELARGNLSLLKKYNHPRNLTQLRSLAADSRRDVHRTQLRNSLDSAMTRFWTLSFQKYRAGWMEYRDRLGGNIEACEMRAPRSGEVVYIHGESRERHIEVGRRVHYKQPIFAITDRSRLTVAGRVSDRLFFSLRPGQRAQVKVAAIPGRAFGGTLTWLARVPTPISKYVPDILHHKLEILLDDTSRSAERLFPGMTADLEIIVDSRPDILQVPASAVIEHRGDHVVLVSGVNGLTRRVIDAGASDDNFVEVKDGLEEGEEVVIDTSESLRRLAGSTL